jgi:hypothetical protein
MLPYRLVGYSQNYSVFRDTLIEMICLTIMEDTLSDSVFVSRAMSVALQIML